MASSRKATRARWYREQSCYRASENPCTGSCGADTVGPVGGCYEGEGVGGPEGIAGGAREGGDGVDYGGSGE